MHQGFLEVGENVLRKSVEKLNGLQRRSGQLLGQTGSKTIYSTIAHVLVFRTLSAAGHPGGAKDSNQLIIL